MVCARAAGRMVGWEELADRVGLVKRESRGEGSPACRRVTHPVVDW